MSADPAPPATDEDLPEPFVRVLGDYERHLVLERNLARHTVTAYSGDIAGLLQHAHRPGIEDVVGLEGPSRFLVNARWPG